jgi:hypothetical protein
VERGGGLCGSIPIARRVAAATNAYLPDLARWEFAAVHVTDTERDAGQRTSGGSEARAASAMIVGVEACCGEAFGHAVCLQDIEVRQGGGEPGKCAQRHGGAAIEQGAQGGECCGLERGCVEQHPHHGWHEHGGGRPAGSSGGDERVRGERRDCCCDGATNRRRDEVSGAGRGVEEGRRREVDVVGCQPIILLSGDAPTTSLGPSPDSSSGGFTLSEIGLYTQVKVALTVKPIWMVCQQKYRQSAGTLAA